ncbi:MAG: electron transfer flavoprotein subunit beta/FixA family protein [Caldisericia bacterium]|nr:electron transfer flavoprotein subunit beta/FixA family protein [Caldisericia bacterium]MDD4613957.1 electron transfer flavoprotein subunit beta/FixA family protein [Caldisericia bacterium]
MKILVLVKQIPDLENKVKVSIDPKNFSMKRGGIPSIMNPADKNAVEAALKIKDAHPSTIVHVISMGPKQAIEVLKEAYSMGADEGTLLSDVLYAGSDTLATSLILTKAIQKIGDFTLILCGKQALDGDTGQVGPGIASRLSIPQVMAATSVTVDDNTCHIQREFRNHVETIVCPLPALIAFKAHCNIPRLPSLRGLFAKEKWEPAVVQNTDLQISVQDLGIEGSPTRVVKTFQPVLTKTAETVHFEDGSTPMEHIMKTIHEVNQ